MNKKLIKLKPYVGGATQKAYAIEVAPKKYVTCYGAESAYCAGKLEPTHQLQGDKPLQQEIRKSDDVCHECGAGYEARYFKSTKAVNAYVKRNGSWEDLKEGFGCKEGYPRIAELARVVSINEVASHEVKIGK